MKWVRFSKYTGDDLDIDSQDLMDALADFFLNSGFDSQFAQYTGWDPNSLDELMASPTVASFPATVKQRAQQAAAAPIGQGPDSDACKADAAYRQTYGAAITATMDAATLDALIYPTWSQPPQLIGQTSQQTAGGNSQTFSPTSGFPAITVPMGYSRDDALPIGMSLLGRAWSEATLLRLAYAYEQATHHRRAPVSTPTLPTTVKK